MSKAYLGLASSYVVSGFKKKDLLLEFLRREDISLLPDLRRAFSKFSVPKNARRRPLYYQRTNEVANGSMLGLDDREEELAIPPWILVRLPLLDLSGTKTPLQRHTGALNYFVLPGGLLVTGVFDAARPGWSFMSSHPVGGVFLCKGGLLFTARPV